MGKLTQRERLENIRYIVREKKRVNVSGLSSRFDVTEETIRRDLDKLENEGLVARTYGGALLKPEDASGGVSYAQRTLICAEEKGAIARIAAELAADPDIAVGVDSSSTAMEAARLLSDREDVILMTYSASLFRDLVDPKAKIISSGGLLSLKSFSFQGVITRNTIKKYHMNICFLSCKGLHVDAGAFDSDENEAEIKRMMVEQSQKVYLLADHTKFGQMSFAKLFDLNRVDGLITDRRPSDIWVDRMASIGVKLLYPEN